MENKKETASKSKYFIHYKQFIKSDIKRVNIIAELGFGFQNYLFNHYIHGIAWKRKTHFSLATVQRYSGDCITSGIQ